MRSGLWLFPTLALPLIGLAAEPSFDCDTASNPVEQLICEDEDLAALDRELAAVYDLAWQNPEAGPPTALGLQSGQRGWIMSVNDCAAAENPHGCVTQHYQFRIAELQALYEMLPATDSMALSCVETGQVRVDFFDTDPPTARLWRDDRAVVTFRVADAGGELYQGGGVTFQPRDEAMELNWEGEILHCVDQPAQN